MKLVSTHHLSRVFLLLGLMLVVVTLVCVCTDASAETMLVSFEVQPCAILDLTVANLVFPPVYPGEVVSEVVQVLVKSNVMWELRVKGNQSAETQDGTLVNVTSQIQVFDYLGYWENICEIAPRIVVNQPPTDSEGLIIDIPLRLQGDFSDPPGTYVTEIEFTLVPQI